MIDVLEPADEERAPQGRPVIYERLKPGSLQQ